MTLEKDNLYLDVSSFVEMAFRDNNKKDWTKMEFCMIRNAILDDLRAEGITQDNYMSGQYDANLNVMSEAEMINFYDRFKIFNNTIKTYESIFLDK